MRWRPRPIRCSVHGDFVPVRWAFLRAIFVYKEFARHQSRSGPCNSMTDTPKAVFLSYASQDAESARRICEALRAGGIEVGFDQSELRCGDDSSHGWDGSSFSKCVSLGPVPVMKTVAGWSPVKAKWGALAGSV
jgi:TIR domain